MVEKPVSPARPQVGRTWADLPLQVKALSVVAIPILALLFVSLSVVFIAQERSRAERSHRHQMQVQAELSSYRAGVIGVVRAVEHALLFQDRDDLTRVSESVSLANESLLRLELITVYEPEHSALVRELRIVTDTLTELGTVVTPQGSEREVVAGLEKALAQADGISARLLEAEAEVVAPQLQKVARLERNSLWVLVLGLGFGLGGGLLTMIVLSRRITRRLKYMLQRSKRFARNRSLYQADSAGDELGQLSQELVSAASLLKQHEATLEQKQVELRRHSADFERLASYRQALLELMNEALHEPAERSFFERLITHAVAVIPGAQAGSLLLREDDGCLRFVAVDGYDLEALRAVTLDPEELVATHRGSRPKLVRDLKGHNEQNLDDVRRATMLTAGRVADIAISLSVPVTLQGQVVAVLSLDNFEDERAFQGAALDMAETLATQVGVLINRFRLEQALREQQVALERQQAEVLRVSEFRRVLVEFTLETLKVGLTDTFYQRLLERAVELIPGAQAGSLLLRADDDLFHYVATVGYELEGLKRITFGSDEFMPEQSKHEPTRIHTYSNIEHFEAERRKTLESVGRAKDIKVALSIPVVVAKEIKAYLNLDNFEDAEVFGAEAEEMARVFAAQVGVILGRLILEQQLRERRDDIENANKALEKANRHKSAFLAAVSHELRTPLTAIIGFSELLKEELFGPLNPRQLQYAQDIFESGMNLLSLINDVLDLSKIEAGHMTVRAEEVDVSDIVERALTIVRERARRKGVEFKADVPEALGTVYADALKLKQILYNLLDNGIKFTPQGGEVELLVTAEADEVAFVVKDTGIGVAEDDLPHLFAEFYQADTSLARQHQGTGLGLALCKRLVELHGGRVWCESQLGEGSTFTFVLPRKPMNDLLSAAPSYAWSGSVSDEDVKQA